jgi:hypothetical protein
MVVRWLVAGLLVACALAGCSSKATPAADPVADLDLHATATTGVLRGIVVDEAIRPVAGVTVHSSCLNQTTVTNANGAYGLQGLPSGTCFLTFTKRGYTTVQSSYDVQAGVSDPVVLRTQIAQLPNSKPYHDILKFHGNQAFAITVFNPVGHTRFVSSVPIFNGTFRSNVEYAPNPTWEQMVLAWEAKTQASMSLQLDHCVFPKGKSTCSYSNNTWGPAPMVLTADAKLMELLTQNETLVDGVVVWAAGSLTGVGQLDVGTTVDQDFDLITVHTYNYAPPAGYRFDLDGEPVDPPL